MLVWPYLSGYGHFNSLLTISIVIKGDQKTKQREGKHMIIQQHTKLKVEKDGKDIVLDVSPDTPLGLIFDALMELKGYIVERMVSSQKEEEAEAEKQMGDTPEPQEGENGSSSEA